MHQTNLCNWLLKSALALAVIAGGADSAFAGWRHHGGGSSGGSSGGWGSSGGYGYGGGSWGGYGSSGGFGSSGGYGGSGGYGSSGGYGYRGGLFHHHRRAGYGGSSGGYYGGSSGGWGSSGGYGSSGGWGSSGGGSSGGWGSSGGAVMGGGYYSPNGVIVDDSAMPMDATPSNPPPPPAGDGEAPADAPPATDGTMLRRANGTLVVEVPADAKIYVNDRLTSTPGTVREYVSRNLVHGYNYSYEVRAEMEIDGKLVSETKKVDLRAGQHAKLAFQLASEASDEVETSITVKVPSDAKVNLGGNDTKAQGETRTFRTSALRKGTEWKDYKIVVTANVDGHEVTKEQTFDLKAGEEKELAFDFDAANVASR